MNFALKLWQNEVNILHRERGEHCPILFLISFDENFATKGLPVSEPGLQAWMCVCVLGLIFFLSMFFSTQYYQLSMRTLSFSKYLTKYSQLLWQLAVCLCVVSQVTPVSEA